MLQFGRNCSIYIWQFVTKRHLAMKFWDKMFQLENGKKNFRPGYKMIFGIIKTENDVTNNWKRSHVVAKAVDCLIWTSRFGIKCFVFSTHLLLLSFRFLSSSALFISFFRPKYRNETIPYNSCLLRSWIRRAEKSHKKLRVKWFSERNWTCVRSTVK